MTSCQLVPFPRYAAHHDRRAADRTVERPLPPLTDLAELPESVGVAGPGEERCGDRAGGLRCVRRPHPDHPRAHVRVAGHYEEPTVELPVDAEATQPMAS